MNIYDLKKQLDQIEQKIDVLILSNKPYYNPWQFIKNDITNLELLWKYQGVYFRKITELYRVVNAAQDIRTFTNIIKSESRITECFAYGIQPVFAASVPYFDNYLITTEGELLFKNTLTIKQRNPRMNSIQLLKGGEKIHLYIDALVMHFLGGYDFEELEFWDAQNHRKGKIFHIDGLTGNCRIDNLELIDKERVKSNE